MRNRESGNVFFYIFLGVALFGALTYAVSQSGRGSVENITREQSRLRATEIIDFSDAVSKAVGTLRLRGVTLSQLRFAHSDLSLSDYGDPDTIDPANMVFHPDGGAIIYKDPSPDILVTPGEQWLFLNQNQIEGFGSTCPAETCSDLIMAIRDIRTDVCQIINKLAGFNNPEILPSDTEFETTGKFKGTITGTPEIIGDETSSATLNGKPFACFKNDDDGKNYFYRVLWAQ